VIKILAIHIEEFRGIRDLRVNLDGMSLVVSGPNGSGKSGIVDAIEFALTGEVSRLKGIGTGSLSVPQHAPHILSVGNPAAARVTLTIQEPVSGHVSDLVRTVASLREFTLNPDTSEVRAAIAFVADHPEVTLSRREITQYIITEPSRRSQQVQTLLKLDRLEKVRTLLRSSKTKANTLRDNAETTELSERTSFLTHVDLPSFDGPSTLHLVNAHRTRLGLTTIDALTSETDLAQGIVDSAESNQIEKESALRDVDGLLPAGAAFPDYSDHLRDLLTSVAELEATPNGLMLLQTEELVSLGSNLVSGSTCPLCDVTWPSEDDLRTHLEEKLSLSADVSRTRSTLMTHAKAIASVAGIHRGQLNGLRKYATSLGLADVVSRINDAARIAGEMATQLQQLNHAIAFSPSDATCPEYFSDDVKSSLGELRAALVALPDQTDRQTSTRYLSVAQDRWSRWQAAIEVTRREREVSNAVDSAYDLYCECQDSALQSMYHSVEEQVSEFYRIVNGDDEAAFRVELRPSEGSLDLVVDFYGLGLYPPAAYHSEGHQDGMGVCLYLALVSQILGDQLSFVVLDDVVMSVDQSHRRQFCELLKSRFPDVQFIITTHDPVWTRQLVKSEVVARQNVLRFVNWSVEGGPVTRQYEDLWEKIDALLAVNEVSNAAWVLRNGMEMACDEIADELRAPIPYTSSGQYELGDLVSGVSARHGSLLRKAAASANAWANQPTIDQVEVLKTTRAAAVIAQQNESWPVNLLVHYNSAAPMSVQDFVPVVDAWKDYVGLFQCKNSDCKATIYVEGTLGNESSLRCRCGDYNLNLALPT
jgi:energy-coupling factor transporter ATP-binding protein EcfA2